MPTFPPFLAHSRVLSATYGSHGVVATNADVAADTLPYVIHVAGFNFSRQERVGNRGAGGAYEIEYAAAYLRHHCIR